MSRAYGSRWSVIARASGARSRGSFFFQAEDGIRALYVTGVQTCDLPISERGEAIRQAVNQWIRTSRAFDAVVDFDAVLRDPARPARLRGDYDPGDHIHPNDLGNQEIGRASCRERV